MEEADVIILVCNIREKLHPKEKTISKLLKSYNKPIVVVGNKADNTDMAEECTIYERLGFGTPFAVSAIHGLGEIDILEELEKNLSK